MSSRGLSALDLANNIDGSVKAASSRINILRHKKGSKSALEKVVVY